MNAGQQPVDGHRLSLVVSNHSVLLHVANRLADDARESGGGRVAGKQIHESQTQSQWFVLYKDYLASTQAQHPHGSATDDMFRAFEHMEGLCGNEAAFTSLVAFRESYYEIHRQVRLGNGLGLGLSRGHGRGHGNWNGHGGHQNKDSEHDRRLSDGSFENEIVRSLALNILDNAMSIVSPQEEGEEEEDREAEQEREGEREGERREGKEEEGGGPASSSGSGGGDSGGGVIIDRGHSPPQLVRILIFL